MTLAECIRLSRETGCEFWRPSAPGPMSTDILWWEEGRLRGRDAKGSMYWHWDVDEAAWTTEDVLADDWQTAPHEEGM